MSARNQRRYFFDALIAFIAIAIIAPATASAQRFSVTPFGGYLWIDPILRHDMQFNGFYTISSSHEKLMLLNSNVFGAELGLWRVRGWQVYVDGGYASSRLRYDYATSIKLAQVPDLAPATTEEFRGDIAKILVVGAGLQRRFNFLSLGVVPKFGLGFTQLQLPKRDYCLPSPVCRDRWDSRYNVPSAVIGFDLRTPSFSSMSAGVSAKVGVGRLDTSGFANNPPSDSFLYEAPSKRWLYTRQVLFGIAIDL